MDRLRPEEQQFQRLLKNRIRAAPTPSRDETKEVNAAYLLLDNAFTKRYPVSTRLMEPESNPNHYKALAKELDELPDRTWFGNLAKRLQNMVRFR